MFGDPLAALAGIHPDDDFRVEVIAGDPPAKSDPDGEHRLRVERRLTGHAANSIGSKQLSVHEGFHGIFSTSTVTVTIGDPSNRTWGSETYAWTRNSARPTAELKSMGSV